MKFKKILLLTPLLFAFNASAMDESENIILKLRANFSFTDGKQTGLPAASSVRGVAAPQSTGKLLKGAYGVEGAATFFVTDHFAGEFASGISIYSGKRTTISAINYNYSNANKTNKKRNLYVVPTSLTLQYHIAPYGAIRPYVGGGYHYTYMIPRASEYKVKNGSGFVFQGGIDVAFKDDTYVNLDVKQYLLKTTVKYNTNFVTLPGGKQVTSKLKLNPVVIALGLGFKL